MAPADPSDLTTFLRERLHEHRDRLAVWIDPSTTVSYRELLGLSAGIGTHLDRLGVAPGAPVAVVGRAGLGTYASLLGALLTRRVPAMIDRGQPAARIQQLLAVLDPVVTLWCGPDDPPAPGGAAALHVDARARVTSARPSPEPAGREVPVFAPAVGYIGFTSGSRGTPRAIVGSAEGLRHFLTWQVAAFDIRPGARFGQLTSPGFDVFYRDLLTPLIGGARVCVPGEDQLSGFRVLDWLAAARVSHLHAVPSLARYWLAGLARGSGPRLSVTFFAGETLGGTLVADWRSAAGPGHRVINLYGAAEATLAQAWYEVPADCGPGRQPVGVCLPGIDIAVLDPENRRCRPGVTGDIVVESPFLSHGYLRGHHRTWPGADALAGPLPTYHTGDRGYRSQAGLLHIVGRADREVKIRGVRVNLDEVTAVLSSHPRVDVAVVVAGQDRVGGLTLEAHLAARRGPAPSGKELRRYLAARLPDQMVPGVYHVWPELPLGATGKLDVVSLASFEKLSVRSGESGAMTEAGNDPRLDG